MSARVPNASRNEQPRGEWAARYMERQQPIAKRRILDGWYRLTAPPEPGPNSTLAQREKSRHGRLISLVLLFVLLLLALISPTSVSGRNHFLLPVLIGALVICIAALALNRKGYGVVAGIILVVGIDIGFAFSLLNTPGGLGVYNLPMFDLPAFTVLLAVSLLPPWSVFVVMAVNCIFIWADLTFQARSPELAQLMAKTGYSIFVRPLILEVIIAVVTYLWVRGANQAIARADRAEVIASLEHAIAEQGQAIIEQKRLLDLGIEQVLQTHVRVSNGDFNARVPLTEESVLWPIAVSLNNLLSRFQRLRYLEDEMQKLQPQIQQARMLDHEFQQMRQEIARVVPVMREARAMQRPVRARRSGTILDPILSEINDNYLFVPTLEER